MLPDWPHDNNACCFIMYLLAQRRSPRSDTGVLSPNLLSGKSMVQINPYLYNPDLDRPESIPLRPACCDYPLKAAI